MATKANKQSPIPAKRLKKEGISMKRLPKTLRRSARLGRYALLVSLAIQSIAAGGLTDAKRISGFVDDVMKQAERSGGLVVVLDNGDATVADEFAKRPRVLMQTLAPTEARTIQLRDILAAQGNNTRATAMTYAPGKLPYADGIVNIFVADDFGPKAGIDVADLVRCLSPNGKAFLRVSKQDEAWLKKQLPAKKTELKRTKLLHQSWTVVTKKRPAGMDEWPQYRHDSARSRTSDDELVAPPVHLRWIHGQRRSRSHKDHPNGAVSAGGRNNMMTHE
jgi:hypothetical protein